MMRWLVLLLALIGSAASLLPAYALYTAKKEGEEKAGGKISMMGVEMTMSEDKEAQDVVKAWNNLQMLMYACAAAVVLGLLGACVAMARRGTSAALLLVIAPLAAIYFAYSVHSWMSSKGAVPPGALNLLTITLVCVGPLVLAGLLAFFIRRPDGATA